MKKIALFGCTADPFTAAHYAIVKGVLTMCPELTNLLVIPTVVNWHRKGKPPLLRSLEKILIIDEFLRNLYDTRAILYKDELNMLENIRPEDPIIAERGFIDTLNSIRSIYEPDTEFYIVLGTDSYRNIKTWRRFNDLMQIPNVKFIVVQGRENMIHHDADLDKKIYKSFRIPPALENCSATHVRDCIRADGSLDNYRQAIPRMCQDVEKFLSSVNLKSDTELLLHTPILDVIKGPEVADGFRPIQLRATDWVTIIPIREKGNVDEVCMVKQLRYGMMKEMIEFPCGTIDQNESPAHCAQRELEEETGIQVSEEELEYIGKLPTNPGCFTNYMHYFYVYLGSDYKVGKTKFDEHEKIEQKWIELKDVEDIVDNIPALMVAGWHCFKHVREGGYSYNVKGE